MSNVYRHLSAGDPGTIGHPDAKVPQVVTAPSVPMDDQPLLEPEPVGIVSWFQFQGDRSAWRNGLRLMQLVNILVSLAFGRPQRFDIAQWATLLVLCHGFVLSTLLLVDRHTRGRAVRRLLPQLDWPSIELRYTAGMALLLYALSYGLTLSHKGYGSNVWCNWVSFVFTLKTALLYGADTWLQLLATYGPPDALLADYH
uniref:Putative succinate dehydrogenase n=1 Tax=Anopheles marajoara TaxID=58244 RepID=A0A2M4C0D4_9DIPT